MCTPAVKSYLNVPSDRCANLWPFVPCCSTKHAAIAEPTRPGRSGWVESVWVPGYPVPGCAFRAAVCLPPANQGHVGCSKPSVQATKAPSVAQA
eukprot:3039334-Rhodomonas_salina.1